MATAMVLGGNTPFIKAVPPYIAQHIGTTMWKCSDYLRYALVVCFLSRKLDADEMCLSQDRKRTQEVEKLQDVEKTGERKKRTEWQHWKVVTAVGHGPSF